VEGGEEGEGKRCYNNNNNNNNNGHCAHTSESADVKVH
jgi:hypothetical protein